MPTAGADKAHPRAQRNQRGLALCFDPKPLSELSQAHASPRLKRVERHRRASSKPEASAPTRDVSLRAIIGRQDIMIKHATGVIDRH
tara:strand:- start:10542 stop:10802 length:261 start_codon:yes stop_codon:yes gene_type:complete